MRSLLKEEGQIFFHIQAVCFSHLHHGIYNRTCVGSAGRITEQPVFSADSEWTDAVLARIVRETAAAILQIGLCIWLLVPGIGDGFLQPAAFSWMLLIQPVPEGFQDLRCLFVPEFMPLFK